MSIVFLLLSFLFLLALVGGVIALIVLSKQRRGGDRLGCGRCGYDVKGLESLICPECGADLREIGTRSPGVSAAARPTLAVLAWSAILPLPAIVSTGLMVAYVMPSRVHKQESLMLIGNEETAIASTVRFSSVGDNTQWGAAGPRAKPIPRLMSIKIETHAEARGQTTRTIRVAGRDTVASTSDGALVIDFAKGEMRYEDPKTRQDVVTPGLKKAAMEAWLKARGVEVSGDDQLAQVDGLFSVITKANKGAGFYDSRPRLAAFYNGGRSSGSGSMPVAWPLITWALGWLALWIAGCFVVYRRMQASRRGVTETPSASPGT